MRRRVRRKMKKRVGRRAKRSTKRMRIEAYLFSERIRTGLQKATRQLPREVHWAITPKLQRKGVLQRKTSHFRVFLHC